MQAVTRLYSTTEYNIGNVLSLEIFILGESVWHVS